MKEYRKESDHKNGELKKWMEKCLDYQKKYESLVNVMKQSLPRDDQ